MTEQPVEVSVLANRPRLTEHVKVFTLWTIEVQFTPEQEAQLSQIAAQAGIDSENLLRGAALRLIAEAALFRAGVERGIAAAERGEFVDSEEIWANVEKLLQS